MIYKEIKLPKLFHELHGEKTRLSTLGVVYVAGILVAGIVIAQILPLAWPVWKVLLVGLLFLDVAGGVAANLSTSTNQYYQKRKNVRLLFILLHIIHPAVMIGLFPEHSLYFGFALVFTLGACMALHWMKDVEFQQNLAALLVATGIALSFLFAVPAAVLYTFAPLFMLKLILGFSVRRPPFVK